MNNTASIDLGSHTARLLIAGVGTDGEMFEPLMRKRSYVYLVESCLEKMRRLTMARRIERLGLDSGRSRVMVAGAAVVVRLLRHLNARELTVSMSDLLEGVLMDFLEGEQHG